MVSMQTYVVGSQASHSISRVSDLAPSHAVTKAIGSSPVPENTMMPAEKLTGWYAPISFIYLDYAGTRWSVSQPRLNTVHLTSLCASSAARTGLWFAA